MKTRKDLVAVLGIGLLAACGGKPASVGPSGDGGGAERAGEITVMRTPLLKGRASPSETFQIDAITDDTFLVKGPSENMTVTIESADTNEVVISFEDPMMVEGEGPIENAVITIEDGETINLWTPTLDASIDYHITYNAD